jgi:hypothetical protein
MSDEDQNAIRKRMYGRGYHDGLRAALKLSGGTMTNAVKMKTTIAGLTGIASKVYDSMPDDRCVNAKEMTTLLYRHTGARADVAIVQGCLSSMVSQHLVADQGHGAYRKAAIPAAPILQSVPKFTSSIVATVEAKQVLAKPAPKAPETSMVKVTEAIPEAKVIAKRAPGVTPTRGTAIDQLTPLEQLAAIERRVKDMVLYVSAEMREIAEQVACAGLSVQDYVDAIKKDGEKVNQLKKLLRDL